MREEKGICQKNINSRKNIPNTRMSKSILSASINRFRKLCCQILKRKMRQKGYITCLSNTVSNKRSYKIWLQRSAQTFYYTTEYYVIVRVWKNYYESCKWELLKDTKVIVMLMVKNEEELMALSITKYS